MSTPEHEGELGRFAGLQGEPSQSNAPATASTGPTTAPPAPPTATLDPFSPSELPLTGDGDQPYPDAPGSLLPGTCSPS